MKVLTTLAILILISSGCSKSKTHKEDDQNQPLSIHKDSAVTDFFRRTSGAIAMDGGFSVPLSDNRVLWLFGDTYVDHFDPATGTVPCLFNVRNSALLQPYGNWQWQQTTTLLSSGPGARNFIKDVSNPNLFIWPGAGIQIGDTIFVYCSVMKNVSGGLGFDNGGPPMWAKFKFPEMNMVGFSPLDGLGNIGFGKAIIKDESGKYIYIYGSDTRKGSYTNNIYVARFSPQNPYKWAFWDGSSWGSDIAKRAVIDSAILDFSWHISKIKNKYLLVTAAFSLGCDQGKDIYASTSDNPTGPFSKRKTIYTLPDTVQGHYPFFYSVVTHPEYIENNELLVTYSINGYSPCVPGCVNNRFNPDYYRLRGIRIPLKFIEDGF